MKRCFVKGILPMALAVALCAFALTSCTSQPSAQQSSEDIQEESSQVQEEEPVEEESPAEEPTQEDGAAVDTSSAEAEPQQEMTGTLVLAEGDAFVSLEGEVLGTQEDLDAWTQAMEQRDQIGQIQVSTWGEEREMTAEEIAGVLDTLAALSPQVLTQLGNPPTGGNTYVLALDGEGEILWRASVNESWLTFLPQDGETPVVLGVEGQEISALNL